MYFSVDGVRVNANFFTLERRQRCFVPATSLLSDAGAEQATYEWIHTNCENGAY